MSQHYEPPKFVIGHSFGGACTLSLAEQIESVRGAVALAAPSDTGHLADLLERMDRNIVSQGVGTVNIGGRDYVIRDRMLADFRSFNLAAQLRQLSKPTMLFHSPVDETLGFEHALRLFAFLTQRSGNDPEPSPTSLICLPDADHLLARNVADIDFVTATIAAWFKRLLS